MFSIELETLFMNKPLVNFTEFNTVIYVTALATTVKLSVKTMKKLMNKERCLFGKRN